MYDHEMAVAIGDDVKADILAALRRIEEVPVGATFIDRISDGDWKSTESADWCITAGSPDESGEHDDLDYVDAPYQAA